MKQSGEREGLRRAVPGASLDLAVLMHERGFIEQLLVARSLRGVVRSRIRFRGSRRYHSGQSSKRGERSAAYSTGVPVGTIAVTYGNPRCTETLLSKFAFKIALILIANFCRTSAYGTGMGFDSYCGRRIVRPYRPYRYLRAPHASCT